MVQVEEPDAHDSKTLLALQDRVHVLQYPETHCCPDGHTLYSSSTAPQLFFQCTELPLHVFEACGLQHDPVTQLPVVQASGQQYFGVVVPPQYPDRHPWSLVHG